MTAAEKNDLADEGGMRNGSWACFCFSQGKGKATQGQASASKKGRAVGQGSGHTSKFLPLPELMYPFIPMHVLPMHVGMGEPLMDADPVSDTWQNWLLTRRFVWGPGGM